jgi:tetratricopeptide (TPR) repeat protein
MLGRALELRGERRRARDEYLAAAAIYEARGVKTDLAEAADAAALQSLELGDAPHAIAQYRRSIDAAASLGKPGELQWTYARAGLGRALGAAHHDADAITELVWALPRIEIVSPPRHRFIAIARLALAEALWRRAGRGDRDRARGLVSEAQDDASAFRAALDDHDPFTPSNRRLGDQLTKQIGGWQAQHR